ncbi:hypothetical protein WA158_004606 [Blastocystis sp. Blastoise]
MTEEAQEEQWNDITNLLKSASKELSDINYVASDDFDIQEAVHAFEFMQPILDNGIEAMKIKPLSCRIEENLVSYDYTIDDVIHFVLLLANEEEQWSCGWSLTKMLTSYPTLYKETLVQLNQLVLQDNITASFLIKDDLSLQKFLRFYVLNYSLLFLQSLSKKIEICVESFTFESDELDTRTSAYLPSDIKDYMFNPSLCIQILTKSIKMENCFQKENLNILFDWINWRQNHVKLLTQFQFDGNDVQLLYKLAEEEVKNIDILMHSSSSTVIISFPFCISESLYDPSLYKLAPVNIPTRTPTPVPFKTILQHLSDSINIYLSLFQSMSSTYEFIEIYRSISHLILHPTYAYIRAAIYLFFNHAISNPRFSWHMFICKSLHIDINKHIDISLKELYTQIKSVMIRTIRSVCYSPSSAFKRQPSILEAWLFVYEMLSDQSNEAKQDNPLQDKSLFMNITHCILSTCCYIILLYVYGDIFNKLTSKYDMGFMSWYLTVLITKMKSIDTQPQVETNTKDKKKKKSNTVKSSHFAVYMDDLWRVIETYMTSLFYIYGSIHHLLLPSSSSLYTYADESIRFLQKVSPINKSPFLPIPHFKNYEDSVIHKATNKELFECGSLGFSTLFKDINPVKKQENNWLKKKEFNDIQMQCLVMSRLLLKIKPSLGFLTVPSGIVTEEELSKADRPRIELDEVNIGIVPVFTLRP